MKVGTVLVATDLNPLYCEFIPPFIAAWKKLIPEADICIVLVADAIPETLKPYAQWIQLFVPIPGIHTAFQAQCVRLLYPRQISRDEGVLITDMDMLPMSRRYYTQPIADISNDSFVVYRDVCLPGEISMCYNIAHPSTWTSMFGSDDTRTILSAWHSRVTYSGEHGGAGWGTDQVTLVHAFNAWGGKKVVLNDSITEFRRLDRADPAAFTNAMQLRLRIQNGYYADYHCLRPYSQYRNVNDFVVSSL